jgi:uncharacterized membrane protein
MITVTLYTRKNCSLCDQAKADLAALKEQYPHQLAVVDVDSDPTLVERFGSAVPVVSIGPYRLSAPIERRQLQIALGAAIDRQRQMLDVHGEKYQKLLEQGKVVTRSDRFSWWISRNYINIVMAFLLLYAGLPFLAPVLMKARAEAPARAIYFVYSTLCHQFGFRSFFLFGEQFYYPLREANVPGAIDFETASGIKNLHDPASMTRFDARSYVGDEKVGYKVAICERDVAIWGSMLLFALLYQLTGRKIRALHPIIWFALALVPIGLDGFSQLFSQFEFSWLVHILPYRESTPFLRVLTGALFGVATAWFGLPNMEGNMIDTRQILIKKFAVAESAGQE